MGRALVKATGVFLVALLMLAASTWGVLALHYWDHANPVLRNALAVAYALVSLALLSGFALRQWRWRSLGVFVLLFALLIACWRAIAPSNERDWEPENAVLAYASIAGDRITLHNIRNFDYRTETSFTPRYYDHSFDLRQLSSVDLFTVYWMGPAIAHVFLSFGFSDGSHVAISIEARKERGEGYSSIRGFFRQYELFYAVGDERDIVRLRTNYRHDPPEQVYLFRLRGTIADGQRLFLDYLHTLNELKVRPEWYNSLTTNCTNLLWLHARVVPGHVPYSWRILLSGYLPEYLYAHGRLETSVPFAELKRRSQINAPAQAADQAADFSQRIRAGLSLK
jgi:hypothetical protein